MGTNVGCKIDCHPTEGRPLVSHSAYDRLPMGCPLRRRGVCMAIIAALFALLALATSVHMDLLGSMRPDVARVFFRALVLSSLIATVPLTALWFLDRRERETPRFFAAAFLWGGCIATALALPFNSAFFKRSVARMERSAIRGPQKS